MSYTIAMLSVHTSPLDMPGRTKDAGGMNVYIQQLARELGQSHIKVDIFTRRTDPSTPSIIQLSPRVRVIHIDAGPAQLRRFLYTPINLENALIAPAGRN